MVLYVPIVDLNGAIRKRQLKGPPAYPEHPPVFKLTKDD